MTEVKLYGEYIFSIDKNIKEIANQLKELVRILAIFVDRE